VKFGKKERKKEDQQKTGNKDRLTKKKIIIKEK